jgi:GT2 family glycosyltransferase
MMIRQSHTIGLPSRTSPKAAQPTASVVVLNYNGLQYLDTCLHSLIAQELPGGLEIIVVDNNSVDGSSDHIRRRFPEVTVIQAESNLGFAAGNNLGIEQSRGRYVVLLNNDTSVRPGWLAALVQTAEAQPGVGAVTSKLVFLDRPDVIQNAGTLVLSDGSGADRGAGEQDHGQYDQEVEVFAACGCGMLLSRAMVEQVGGFDPTFFTYYEDTDLSWRMRLFGWRVVYQPKAVVDHVHSGTSVEWSPFFTFHVDRNRLFMIIKNAPVKFVVRSFGWYAWLAAQGAARAVVRRGSRISRSPRAVRISPAARARIHLHVLSSVVRHLPEMLAKRRWIRKQRVMSDAEILRWFYPRKLWDAR